MKLQGHTKLEINNMVVFEKKNDITAWVNKALHEGDYGGVMPETWKMPLSQWFSGCLLTSLTNDATLADGNYCLDSLHEVGGVISGNTITAQASDGDYSGTNTKRGRKANSTAPVANGYKFVWEWNADEGNGNIASVCLTRGNNGGVRFADTYTEIAADNDVKSIFEVAKGISLNTYTQDADLIALGYSLNLIDYENEIGYNIALDTTTWRSVIIKGYRLNTKVLHLDGLNCLPISTTPIVEQTITLDRVVRYVNVSFTFTGDEIHIFLLLNTNELVDYVVDTDTWTYTKNDYTGLEIAIASGLSDSTIIKDAVALKTINNELFAWVVSTDGKFYKLNLSTSPSATAVKSYTNPLNGLPNHSFLSCPSLTLPNGDIIFIYSRDYAVYFSYGNDTMYAVPNAIGRVYSMNGNDYGTVIIRSEYGLYLCTAYPYVSTVNNLNSLATKNYGDQMRLTYTITEVYPDDE